MAAGVTVRQCGRPLRHLHQAIIRSNPRLPLEAATSASAKIVVVRYTKLVMSLGFSGSADSGCLVLSLRGQMGTDDFQLMP